MDQALTEYFQCPRALPGFAERAGTFPGSEGYFRFFDTIGYGRLRGEPAGRVTTNLPDVSNAIGCEESKVSLPFDLSEVVGNLRFERYCRNQQQGNGSFSGTFARRTYYFFRPILPVALRKHLQQLRLRGWEQIPFPRWPIEFSVDRLMTRALALLMKHHGIDKVPFVWFWPDGASSCAIITHDVEAPAGREFCAALMDLDGSFGLKSSFQVVPEGRNYDSAQLVAEIRCREFEGNLHDLNHDGYLFQDREEFLRRAVHINRYARDLGCLGFRAGAMYRNQEWFDRLEFDYDMSVPNVAHLEPQRGGCCTVMPYFVGRLVELPLTTTQDYSLFHILGDYSTTLWIEEIELLIRNHGLITILTHPDYLIENRARTVYRDLLAHLREMIDRKGVWHALPREVSRWWRDRSAMKLIETGGQWRIEGPGCEHARLAYAMLEGDRLVYEVDGRPPA